MLPIRIGVILIALLVFAATESTAHRSGCHRWHSCPSDRGTYVCGDLGYCSGCPDNEYCKGGQARAKADEAGDTAAEPRRNARDDAKTCRLLLLNREGLGPSKFTELCESSLGKDGCAYCMKSR